MVKNARKLSKQAKFGAVSAITTAPVAIGNSMRGSKPKVTNYAGGARVVGRDFAFALKGTASTITNWELIGGMPITPSVLASSVLRNYCQMFSQFKVNRLVAHYITSSPTSQAGDVMFYYEKNRKAPAPDYSNASFLPYVLSDPLTVIGPQWTNHSLVVDPVKDWKSTLYGMNADLNDDAAGSIFFFSKTNATSSPGYIVIDYDITFKEMSVNPRAGTLPISRGQWNNFTIGQNAVAVTAGTTLAGGSGIVLRGNDISNTTAAFPTGIAYGDVYKCIACATASTALNTWTNVTLSTLLNNRDDIDTSVVIDDGYTFYIRYFDNTVGAGGAAIGIYSTLEAAIIGTGANLVSSYTFGVTATVTWALIVNASLVYNVTALTQSAY